jgi:hypothetical protein
MTWTEEKLVARYIVVEVEDNANAQIVIDEWNVMCKEAIKQGDLMRIVGIFVRPGQVCICQDRQTVNYRDPTKDKNAAGVTRGEKFGWWVCSRCGKPRQAGHQLVNQLLPSEIYEISKEDSEFTVDGLSITTIFKKNIPRPKKLRRKKKEKA